MNILSFIKDHLLENSKIHNELINNRNRKIQVLNEYTKELNKISKDVANGCNSFKKLRSTGGLDPDVDNHIEISKEIENIFTKSDNHIDNLRKYIEGKAHDLASQQINESEKNNEYIPHVPLDENSIFLKDEMFEKMETNKYKIIENSDSDSDSDSDDNLNICKRNLNEDVVKIHITDIDNLYIDLENLRTYCLCFEYKDKYNNILNAIINLPDYMKEILIITKNDIVIYELINGLSIDLKDAEQKYNKFIIEYNISYNK